MGERLQKTPTKRRFFEALSIKEGGVFIMRLMCGNEVDHAECVDCSRKVIYDSVEYFACVLVLHEYGR